jgi:4-hydroxy-3-polyprenylbenzoate decarboxylase
MENIMPFKNLQELVKTFKSKKQLVKIKESVNPNLEIAEITDRVVKKNGPALLFQNPKDFRFPVLTNQYGTLDRIRTIFNIQKLDDLGEKFTRFLEIAPPKGWVEKLKLLPKLKEAANIFPKTVKQAPCQEIINTENPDLTQIPVLTCWPHDGGPFITLPVVITRHPVTGKRNVGMYRMQVYNPTTAGLHWHVHKDGADHYRNAASGEPFPVAVALGPDPITTYCATAPLPDGLDEILLSGFLRQKPVEMVKCITCDLEVPAESQFVLEGTVTPGELRTEGPFGDHTGYYSPADQYPVFHLTAITHRKNPIYPATLVGYPPMEDQWLGKVTERLFLPLIKQQMPEIVDMNLPVEGCFHNLCFVSIQKRYPAHAQKVMQAIWGLGQMMFSKMIFVFDKDVDVQDLSQVLFHLGGNVDPGRDITRVKGPVDALDHASTLPHVGTKMGVDCTAKWPTEGYDRGWPELLKMSPEVVQKIDNIWRHLGL